jgi:hypothetical protein
MAIEGSKRRTSVDVCAGDCSVTPRLAAIIAAMVTAKLDAESRPLTRPQGSIGPGRTTLGVGPHGPGFSGLDAHRDKGEASAQKPPTPPQYDPDW